MKDDVRTEMNNVALAALEAQKANPENAMDVSAALFPTCVALLAASLHSPSERHLPYFHRADELSMECLLTLPRSDSRC
jgi:hypothetical protein